MRITYAPDSTPDYDIGTVATYQCNPGFNLEGNATKICVPLKNNAMWSGEDELRSCITASGLQEAIVISAALGGVVLLLLIVIIIVVLVIIVSRRKSKSREESDSYVIGGHIYEDPDLIRFSQPALPSRNIRMGGNQAYEKTFQMTGNDAYNKEPTVGSTIHVISGEAETNLTSPSIPMQDNQAYKKTINEMTIENNVCSIDDETTAAESGYVNVDSDGNEMVEDDNEDDPAFTC